MNGVEFATMNLRECLGLLGTAASGMTDEQYNFQPGGETNAAAKTQVHALTSVSFFINAMIGGTPMDQLAWGGFAGEHGLPSNPMSIWSFEGTIPYAPMQEFAKAVTEAALAQMAKLTDDDLSREIDTRFFGVKPIGFVVQLAAMHAAGHAGDIAAVKGVQGLKGLPF